MEVGFHIEVLIYQGAPLSSGIYIVTSQNCGPCRAPTIGRSLIFGEPKKEQSSRELAMLRVACYWQHHNTITRRPYKMYFIHYSYSSIISAARPQEYNKAAMKSISYVVHNVIVIRASLCSL